ncbi:FAD/NAD(P)-binding domain-containing protein [Hypoxylon sp. FL1284]|nr:FAD/NAD(P)-binding domain-containing protein [Hypoxylon sp. FL1284]
MTKTIVILGAGIAGLPLAHFLVSRVQPSQPDLRIVLVSPLTHFYFGLASVRFCLPGRGPAMAEDRYLHPVADGFARYPHAAERFQFLVGSATALDADRNVVAVTLNGDGDEAGQVVELEYHTLVVATGTRYADGAPWKALGSTAETRAAVASLQDRIGRASTVVVGGAGATGVEFAGELGAAYARAKSDKKTVTILSASALPLEPRLQGRVRRTARRELEKLGVEFVGGARILSVAQPENGDENGKTQITIEVADPDDGSKSTRSIAADLFVPTYGVEYNTSFAPPSMLSPDAPGRLLQGPDLRVPGRDNVFVVGDAGSLEPAQAVHAVAQARHLMTQFRSYLAGGAVEPYQKPGAAAKVTFAATVGPKRGLGQADKFQLPSFLVWWLKGRYLGTDKAGDFATGKGDWPK